MPKGDETGNGQRGQEREPDLIDNRAEVVAAWHDITEQAQATQALSESENLGKWFLESLQASELRFRSVVETASAAIVTADSQGRITLWNHMAEKIFGYTAEEIIGTPLTRIVPERFQATHEAGMQRVLSTGRTRLAGETFETIGARKGGDEFPIEMSLAMWKTGETSFFTALMHDITQRKQFDEAMREAKQFIETLIKASPLAVTAVDLDQIVRLWNPAAERIFGWTEDEVLGQRCPIFAGAKREEIQGLLAETLAGQAVLARETVRHRKDGSPINVSIWTAPLYDAQGTIRDVMVVFADITERKRAEGALRRYAQQQATLYSIGSAVASTLDQDRLVPAILEALLPALGAAEGWILISSPLAGAPPGVALQYSMSSGHQVIQSVAPIQDCPIYRSTSREPVAGCEPCEALNRPSTLPQNASGRHLQSSVCIPLTARESILGILKIGWREPYAPVERGLDLLLSIGRQVSMALHNAQLYAAAGQVNRLRALSELDRALAVTLELKRLAEVTLHHLAAHLDAPAAFMLLLRPPHQGQPAMQVFAPARGWEELAVSGQDTTHLQGLVDRVRAQRCAMPFDVEKLPPLGQDGEPAQKRAADALLVPIWGEKTLLAVLMLGGRRADRPFTEQDRALAQVAASHAGQAMQNAQLYCEVRQLLHEQQQARAQLLQVEKLGALGRLAATIAHEISNPLQAVEGCLTLFHEEMAGSQRREKLDRYLEIIGGEVGRISAIVRRMRDYYRPAQERLQPTNLPALLDSVLALSGKELQHHHIRVEREGSRELPFIEGNPDHLRQVFMNLVLNAIDAMPDGGTLRISTGLDQMPPAGGEPPQPAARVEIRDTGVGMPPEIQVRLFEPFFSTKAQAAGLGLSISYSIVEAHNGQIQVASEVGSGSTFIILLPIAAQSSLNRSQGRAG